MKIHKPKFYFAGPKKNRNFYKFGGEFLFVILLSLFFFIISNTIYSSSHTHCGYISSWTMSNRMFISSTKNACVIKLFKDQVNLSEPLYRMTRDCGSPKHGDIYDCKFSFLEREKLLIFI